VLKFGIHQVQAGRKGVRRGEEVAMIRGAEASIVRNFTTKLDWAAVYSIIFMLEQAQRRHAVSTIVSRWLLRKVQLLKPLNSRELYTT
jgi:hypothetical protein